MEGAMPGKKPGKGKGTRLGNQVRLASAAIVAFAATAKPDEAMAFYRDTLGLTLAYADQFALVFDCRGTTLRVAVVPKVKPAGYTILGWQVADIDAMISALSGAGVEFSRFPGMDHESNGVWKSPSGARIAWFQDPDGNTLSLTEL
jgi:catechol 2,3-dioxygenase-like lactoylglutathione lyase family enzyme